MFDTTVNLGETYAIIHTDSANDETYIDEYSHNDGVDHVFRSVVADDEFMVGFIALVEDQLAEDHRDPALGCDCKNGVADHA